MNNEEKEEALYQLSYDPKVEDITTKELALVVGLNLELQLMRHPVPESALKLIPADVIRHYRVTDVTEVYNKLKADNDIGKTKPIYN